ncbi:hypothetical protein [Xanthobacter sediminis]
MTETDKTVQERERFQAWWDARISPPDPSPFPAQFAWEAWQARAALDTVPAKWRAAMLSAAVTLRLIATRGASCGPIYSHALTSLHRIADALADAPQPPASASASKVEPVTCIACEGHPQDPNDPCAICGASSAGKVEPVAQAVREAVVRAVNEELHRQEDSGQMEARGWNSTAIGDVAIEAMSTHAHTPVAWRARYIGERGWSFYSADSQIDTHEIEEMHPLYLFPPAHPDDFERGAEAMREACAREVESWDAWPVCVDVAGFVRALPLPKKER